MINQDKFGNVLGLVCKIAQHPTFMRTCLIF